MIEAATGNLQLIVGTGEKGDGPDGDPLQCKLARPHGIFLDANGDLHIGDRSYCLIDLLDISLPLASLCLLAVFSTVFLERFELAAFGNH